MAVPQSTRYIAICIAGEMNYMIRFSMYFNRETQHVSFDSVIVGLIFIQFKMPMDLSVLNVFTTRAGIGSHTVNQIV